MQGDDAVTHRRLKNRDHAWDKSCEAGTTQENAKDLAFDLAVELL
jgi:hypothetical protein